MFYFISVRSDRFLRFAYHEKPEKICSINAHRQEKYTLDNQIQQWQIPDKLHMNLFFSIA